MGGCDPGLGPPVEKIKRHRTVVENEIVEAPDIETRTQLRLRSRAQGDKFRDFLEDPNKLPGA